MATGEGSRGGKIIRHTKSGKAVYAESDNSLAIKRNAISGASYGAALHAAREAAVGATRSAALKKAGNIAAAEAHGKFALAATGVVAGAWVTGLAFGVSADIARDRDNKVNHRTLGQRSAGGAKDLGAFLGGGAAALVGGQLAINGGAAVSKAVKAAAPKVQKAYEGFMKSKGAAKATMSGAKDIAKVSKAKTVFSSSSSSSRKISGLLGYKKG